MTKAEKKAVFIRGWYIDECSNLNFSNKLKLARLWIEICLKDEEYEMAQAIKEERDKIVKRHIKEKRRKRKFSQKLIVFIYILKRKINAWFRSKLLR
jgi:hypothetical protein